MMHPQERRIRIGQALIGRSLEVDAERMQYGNWAKTGIHFEVLLVSLVGYLRDLLYHLNSGGRVAKASFALPPSIREADSVIKSEAYLLLVTMLIDVCHSFW